MLLVGRVFMETQKKTGTTRTQSQAQPQPQIQVQAQIPLVSNISNTPTVPIEQLVAIDLQTLHRHRQWFSEKLNALPEKIKTRLLNQRSASKFWDASIDLVLELMREASEQVNSIDAIRQDMYVYAGLTTEHRNDSFIRICRGLLMLAHGELCRAFVKHYERSHDFGEYMNFLCQGKESRFSLNATEEQYDRYDALARIMMNHIPRHYDPLWLEAIHNQSFDLLECYTDLVAMETLVKHDYQLDDAVFIKAFPRVADVLHVVLDTSQCPEKTLDGTIKFFMRQWKRESGVFICGAFIVQPIPDARENQNPFIPITKIRALIERLRCTATHYLYIAYFLSQNLHLRLPVVQFFCRSEAAEILVGAIWSYGVNFFQHYQRAPNFSDNVVYTSMLISKFSELMNSNWLSTYFPEEFSLLEQLVSAIPEEVLTSEDRVTSVELGESTTGMLTKSAKRRAKVKEKKLAQLERDSSASNLLSSSNDFEEDLETSTDISNTSSNQSVSISSVEAKPIATAQTHPSVVSKEPEKKLASAAIAKVPTASVSPKISPRLSPRNDQSMNQASAMVEQETDIRLIENRFSMLYEFAQGINAVIDRRNFSPVQLKQLDNILSRGRLIGGSGTLGKTGIERMPDGSLYVKVNKGNFGGVVLKQTVAHGKKIWVAIDPSTQKEAHRGGVRNSTISSYKEEDIKTLEKNVDSMRLTSSDEKKNTTTTTKKTTKK
jgi:hypothetical protein